MKEMSNIIHYYELTLREHTGEIGLKDCEMLVKSLVDLKYEFRYNTNKVIDWLGEDAVKQFGGPFIVTEINEITAAQAKAKYDLTNEANWPVYGQYIERGAICRVLPKLQPGVVKDETRNLGRFEITPNVDPHYPGVDIDFVPTDGRTDVYSPRVLFELDEGELKVRVWADPKNEDPTHNIGINLEAWKKI